MVVVSVPIPMGDSEPASEESDSEDAERQLEDIIEYIRFAAINIVNEAQSLQEGNSENLQS